MFSIHFIAQTPSYVVPLWQSLLGSTVAASVVTLIGNFLFVSKTARIQNELRALFDRQNALYLASRKWQEARLTELLGPLYMQFERTWRAASRYKTTNVYLEAKVLKVGNETIRDLLLTKGHLIPSELLSDAGQLVEHYDRWLEEFERLRSSGEPELESKFIFVAPHGYPFPRRSEERFKRAFKSLLESFTEEPSVGGDSFQRDGEPVEEGSRDVIP